jgi:hypothetical protein
MREKEGALYRIVPGRCMWSAEEEEEKALLQCFFLIKIKKQILFSKF